MCAKRSGRKPPIEKIPGYVGVLRLGIDVYRIVYVVIVKSLLRDPCIISKVKRPPDRIKT